MLDHRLVQTAVIGHKNSDHPVILPMDAWELDRWRKAHPNYSYWCGLQLGGCGGELSDCRYTTKVCHFAHHPTAPACHRRNNGESSADHLFIKRGVQRLLGKRQLRGQVQTRDLGTGPGDAVDVLLSDSRRRLRFQLAAVDYRAWRRADDELAAEADDIDWILASEGAITQQLLGRHGYCLRVRCETVGGERRVHIGAEAQDRTVSWTPLEDCALTPSGLVTPDKERIRLSRPRPKPTAFPLQGGLVFALAPEADAPADSPFTAENRRLLVADLRPMDSPIVRALISLPADSPAPPAEHVYRVTDGARLLVAEGITGWAVEASRYVRLNALEAQRTGLWTPPATSEQMAPTSPTSRENEPKSVAARRESGLPATAEPVPLTKSELVTAVRDALAHHARLQSTTTWETLARTVSPQLAEYSIAERQSLLVAVDSPLREHVPLLSALLREHGEPLPYLSQVLSRVGVLYSSVSTRIKRWAAVETERAFAAYGVPPRTMPDRLSLKPTQPAVQRPIRTVEVPSRIKQVSPVRSRRPFDRHALMLKHQGATVAPGASTVKYLRSLVRELEGMLPALTKAPRKRARAALSAAQIWLALHDGKTLPASQRAVVAGMTLGHYVSAMDMALTEAKESARAAKRDQSNREVKQLARVERYRRASELAAGAKRSAARSASPPAEDPVGRLMRQLVSVAAEGGTTTLESLGISAGPRDPRDLLGTVDRNVSSDVPLLSALVTGGDGGPVPFFRDILRSAGLAVPQTDQALLAIWRCEQDRAHAAYGHPPRPMPPRIVPSASQHAPHPPT
ncbi:hypothetical protein ABT116_17595 [Streptomyces sp. NPDC002130]|uniref:hypothetical protein n=1 Tax=Streptomyces sp. NPDC002130 TaxID=3155568 RepID=UPI0033177639